MDIILDRVLCFHPEDSKTNVCVPFSLNRDYGCLELFCSYEPLECDDELFAKRLIEEGLNRFIPPEYRKPDESWRRFLPLVSLITLSLDASGEYLGSAHRRAPEQRHLISAGHSSPGFFRHAARAGDWRAVINLHSLVNSEVRYHLRILAHDREVPD
jgi:hypothetical protein